MARNILKVRWRLESFRFILLRLLPAGITLTNIDLGCNTELETLTFLYCSPSMLARHGRDLVDQVTSCNILEINILMAPTGSDRYPEALPMFNAIDGILQRSNFANLEGVNFMVDYGGNMLVNASWLQDNFPRSFARGLVHIVQDDRSEWRGLRARISIGDD